MLQKIGNITYSLLVCNLLIQNANSQPLQKLFVLIRRSILEDKRIACLLVGHYDRYESI